MLRILRFVSVLFAALGLSFGATHVLELAPRLQYDPVLYAAVTSTLYRWFGPAAGVIQPGAVLLATVFAARLRGRPGFRPALAGALALALSVLLWALLVAPVNAAWAEVLATAPESAPAAYARLRPRWEYGHVVAFAAWLVGFCLVLAAALTGTSAERPAAGPRRGP